jgi:hypothetical protein
MPGAPCLALIPNFAETYQEARVGAVSDFRSSPTSQDFGRRGRSEGVDGVATFRARPSAGSMESERSQRSVPAGRRGGRGRRPKYVADKGLAPEWSFGWNPQYGGWSARRLAGPWTSPSRPRAPVVAGRGHPCALGVRRGLTRGWRSPRAYRSACRATFRSRSCSSSGVRRMPVWFVERSINSNTVASGASRWRSDGLSRGAGLGRARAAT